MIELNYGSFYRSIPLSYPVKSDKAEASYNKGALGIIRPKPKSETVRDKQIEVNVKKKKRAF